MDSVFIAARAGVDENVAAPSATVAGPNSTSLRVIVMGTSLSRETLPEAWRAGEGMSSGKVAPQGFEAPDGRRRLLVARRPVIWRTVVERRLAESQDEPRLAVAAGESMAIVRGGLRKVCLPLLAADHSNRTTVRVVPGAVIQSNALSNVNAKKWLALIRPEAVRFAMQAALGIGSKPAGCPANDLRRCVDRMRRYNPPSIRADRSRGEGHMTSRHPRQRPNSLLLHLLFCASIAA